MSTSKKVAHKEGVDSDVTKKPFGRTTEQRSATHRGASDPGFVITPYVFPSRHRNQVTAMITLGIVLIILGLVLPSILPTFAFAHLCLVIGVILLVVGLILLLVGRAGHPVGGRAHYY